MIRYFYLPVDSFYHKLDPRSKILLTVAHLIAVTVLIEQLWLMFALLFEVLFIVVVSKTSPNIKRIRVVVVMVTVMSFVSWLFVGHGETQIWEFLYKEPMLMGISSALRNSIGIMICVALLSATRNEDIAQGCIKFGLPYRGAFAFSSALRMAPVLLGMVLTVFAAQKSRGLDIDHCSFPARVKRSIPLLVPAFLLTMRSTEQLSMAIVSKGFGYPVKQRGNYIELRLKTADYICIGYSILLSVISILIRINGWFSVFNAGI